MAILKKSVALLLTVLLAFSSWSVLASAAWDPAVQPNDLSLEVKLYRNGGTELSPNWVEVNDTKLAPGEKVKARIFVGTDYYTYAGNLLLFYDTDFFTTSYGNTAQVISINPANNYLLMAEAAEGTVGVRAVQYGFITEEYRAAHGDIYIAYNCVSSLTHQKLDANQWLCELDLTVRSDVATMAPDGAIFFLESTIRTPDRNLGFITVPNCDSTTVGAVNCSGMQLWEADVTIVNNDVLDGTADGNCGSITNTISFDANGGTFPSIDNPQVKSGIIGTALNFSTSVVEPTRADYSFVGWYPADFEGTPTASDCVASDNFDYTALSYKALWAAADVTLTFDANGGRFSDNSTSKDVEASSGNEIVFPEAPTLPGYSFEGWRPAAGGDILGDGALAPETDETYVAVWAPEGTPYKLILNYHNVITDNDVAYTISDSGTTGNTVRIVETMPGTPDADSIYYTYDELAAYVTNYELDTTDTRNEFTEVILGDGTTQLNLYFKVVDYTATFDANGGKYADNTTQHTTTQSFYSFITGPAAAPTRTGYDFNGWDPTFTQGSTRMLGNRTFNAQWAPKTYNAVFMIGEDEYFTSPTQFGGDIIVPPTPSGDDIPEGYTFNGWIPHIGDVPPVMDTEGKTFNADLVPIGGITVTFDANGGEFAGSLNQKTTTGTYGTVITTPETPTNGTATFDGWFTLANEQFVPGTTTFPASNITYYASWLGAATHNATFNANGGAFSDLETTKTAAYAENTYIGNPGNPARDGFTFRGWLSDSNEPYVAGTTKMGTADVTFLAQWAKNVDVVYNANGSEFERFATYAGAEIPEPGENPVKTGHIFVGWELTSGEISQDDPVVPESGLEFDAKFEAVPYTVSYSYTGTVPAGAPTLPANETHSYGDTVTVASAPTLENYSFSGWASEQADLSGATFIMPAENVVITGAWEIIPADGLTVTYHNASGSVFTVQTYEAGDPIVPPTETPTAEGMTFTGWTTDPNAATPPALPETMPDHNVDAYPQWSLNKYSVTYISDGTPVANYPEVTFGSEVPVPTDPTKDGFIFAGWTPNVPPTMPAANLEFTAQWTAIPGPGEYTVTYYSAFNKTFRTYTAHEGEPVPTPETDPTLFGHTFTGWTPEIPDTMPAGNLEFNAQWKVDDAFVAVVIGGTVVAGGAIAAAAAVTTGISIAAVGGAIIIGLIASADTYTVTYIVDGETYRTFKVLAGAKVPVPAAPSKDGYTFSKWSPDIPDRMPNHDLTFEAKWSKGGTASVDDEIPQTGSATGSVTAFALLSAAAACAYLVTRKKREEF